MTTTFDSTSFDGYNVPLHTQGSLLRYVNDRCRPGGFVEAILAGDHSLAQNRADTENQISFNEIIRWIDEQMPEGIWGSYQKVQQWYSN